VIAVNSPPTTYAYFWDAANSRCYRSTGTSNTSWIDQPMQPSILETNEGGEVQVDFNIDEDRAGTIDEDSQELSLISITSDNVALVPNDRVNTIKAFYDLNDNGIADTGEFIADAVKLDDALKVGSANDSKLHKLFLKIFPVGGVSGNANITVKVSDGALSTSKTFSLIVHSISALHGGWTNIAASGIKTDKHGVPVSPTDIQCSYNKMTDTNSCADASGVAQDCVGTTSPHSVIIPKAANVVFYDSLNKKCYRSQNPPDKFSWLEMNTACPITKDAQGNYLIYSSAIDPTPSATAIGQYSYETVSNTCYVSTAIGAWSPYVPAKVTLAWNNFSMTGTGADANVQIAGWNVYRREINSDYNFATGFLKDVNSSATMSIPSQLPTTFTDKTAVAGKVYFYTVRPIDNIHFYATFTPEIFSEVRVLAPPENYAFVHRWAINQEICNKMNMTTTTVNKVDPTHNYRCPYTGPGDTVISGVHYYDYPKDLLVDISETGCPYSDARVPGCGNNGCVGIGAPTPAMAVSAGMVYYDRSSGICSISTVGNWARYTGTALIQSNSALNPPLTHISGTEAVASCSSRAAPVVASGGATFNLTTPVVLPEKMDYMAYSAPQIGLTDTQISDLEQGFSLDVQSRCNSSSANGLTGFTDSVIPSSSFMYSVPGTATSGIRSLITGSVPVPGITFATESCVSRYGVQDIYGNVAQLVQDSMTCYGSTSVSPNDPFTCMSTGATKMTYDFGTIAAPSTYGFNGVTGPFYDKNSIIIGPDAGDDFISEWSFVDRLFGAGNFSFPLGLPIHTDILTNPKLTLLQPPTLMDIGTGITGSQLHGDGVIVNGINVINLGGGLGSFAVGGSYLSGLRSGRYTMELVPANTINRSDIGFRCIAPINGYTTDTIHPYNNNY
jgi:hypothetical protein